MNLNENIFWKMIQNQKNKDPNKLENIEQKPRPSLTKPIKKLNSTFLERIEKKEQIALNPSTQILYRKRGSLKSLEQQELEKIEKLSTINKIIKLQNFCKEMISTKERFSKNKTEMISKINKNCLNYYKNKIKMKEIYDFCQSKRPEEHIDYILIENPESYFDIKYDNIYNFLFMLRNNNKVMLKLMQYCPEVNYEQLSDFIVNFFYEDTINSSFIQEELMLLIYLIFEKNLYEKLPNEIKIEDNDISFNIFRNKTNILYFIIKSLTRKADIRNFLCSILVENILKLEGNRKYLSPDVFSKNNLDDAFQESDKDENKCKSNAVKILKKYTLSGEIDSKIKMKYPFNEKINLNRACTNINENNKYEKNMENLDKIKENNIINEENEINNCEKDNSEKEENLFNPYLMLKNGSNYNLKGFNLDQFFENNNASSEFIKKKLDEYEHYSKTNPINLAMVEYLNLLLKNINNNSNKNLEKDEIYSTSKLIKVLKIIKIKEDEKEKDNSFNKIIEMIKSNYKKIIEIIDNIIEKLDENITSVPFTIKCISNIIEQILKCKYSKNSLPNYQKYIFKSNFFIGNILLSCIIDRDYNGIITSDVTSKITTKNLKIIYDILDKLLSGKLFTNDNSSYLFFTLFNKYIILTIPKIFNIIDKIEKKFKLPDLIQRLINTLTDKKVINKRLNDFEYDYFFEKNNEDIQYQSVCFNLQIIGLLSSLINEIKIKENYINNLTNEKDKIILLKFCDYKNEFFDNYNNTRNNENKCEFFILNKLIFSEKVQKKINSIMKDNYSEVNVSQNKNNFSIFKKCLMEVLSYVNIIDKESFYAFILNRRELIHNYEDNKKIYKKNRMNEYLNIISDGNDIKKNNFNEIIDINFKDVLFQKIMDYLKYEIGFNIEDEMSQRIIFCTTYIQSHMEDVPKEYSNNNYCKLFMELIRETLTILNYLNSNILNQLYIKIKEGDKLNMIISSNSLQIKSMEKFKCIEYLYSKILLPNKFKIEKDEKGIVTKIEYIREKAVKKAITTALQSEQNNLDQKNIDIHINIEKKAINEDEVHNKNISKSQNDHIELNNNNENRINNENNNDSNNINENSQVNNPIPSLPKLESIKNLIDLIPDYRAYEEFSDEIIKLEENSGLPDALKNFFRTLKIIVKKEKVIKRFLKEEIDSIVIELENYVLFKLYDKLYPTKSSKDDIRFYKKCLRLEFIKPHNLITDKNIVNENLWETCINYLNEIEDKFTPADKIKCISKAFTILQNSITFCSGKKELGVDDTIKPLIYILLKTKPKNMFTNYNYCQSFLNADLAKKQYGILLTQIYMIMRIIKDMKYNELIGVTEKQFGKDEEV